MCAMAQVQRSSYGQSMKVEGVRRGGKGDMDCETDSKKRSNSEVKTGGEHSNEKRGAK